MTVLAQNCVDVGMGEFATFQVLFVKLPVRDQHAHRWVNERRIHGMKRIRATTACAGIKVGRAAVPVIHDIPADVAVRPTIAPTATAVTQSNLRELRDGAALGAAKRRCGGAEQRQRLTAAYAGGRRPSTNCCSSPVIATSLPLLFIRTCQGDSTEAAL